MPTTPLDPATNHLRYLILAIQAEGERRLTDAFRNAGLDLTATQSEVLEVLAVTGPLSQGELAERLVCTKGNVSRLIDRMAAKDLLHRESDPNDRRRARIALTDRGHEQTRAAYPTISELLTAIRSLYDQTELEHLNRLLARLSDAFGIDVDARLTPPAPEGTR